jgi:hypothetical protein
VYDYCAQWARPLFAIVKKLIGLVNIIRNPGCCMMEDIMIFLSLIALGLVGVDLRSSRRSLRGRVRAQQNKCP